MFSITAPRYFKPVLAGCLSVLLLSSCALFPSVGPDYQQPKLSVPEKWSNGKASQSASVAVPTALSQWWRQLGDRELDDLIDQALTGNLDLKIAQARLRQARASRSQAVGAYFPTLSASVAASRAKYPAAMSSQPTQTFYDAGFDASWEIDLFGGTRRAVEAADADVAASAADMHNVRVSLLAEVAQNYIDLRSYQRRLTIARNNLASQDETLQITQWRNQAGLASSNDVEQAQINREQTRASLPDLELGLAAAENRLAILLGRNPGSLHDRLAETRPLPNLPASVATGIPADVLRQRPDLVAAERRLAAETARVGQKQAQRFPSLSISGAFGWQSYSFAALGGSASLVRTVAGSLAATLFDGGRLRSAVEVQSAVQEQSLLSYERSVLSALEEVENALIAHAAARERVDARQTAAGSARNSALLARNMFESGLSDFQRLLEADRTRLFAEDSLAVAEATRFTTLIKLYKTLGGGWEHSGSAPETPPPSNNSK
ncbi:MAG: efflux system, outer rane lipoprotein NodT [Proteobacteria bacterium]|nr:efflux system, outer rane lipoprotein NodT [Pseudomonadota bacterium]